MTYGLYPNGKYISIKSDKELDKKLKDLEYVLFDNSTPLKGPTFTLVKANKVVRLYNKIRMTTEMSIIPIMGEISPYYVANEINIDDYCRQYSIYPLAIQTLAITDFKSLLEIPIDNLFVDNVYISSDKSSKTLCQLNYYEGEFYKNFKCAGIATHIQKVLDDNHIIFKNGEWSIVAIDKLPKKFDYIFYNLLNTETLYYLSYKQYKILNKINHLEIVTYGVCILSNYDWEEDIDALLMREYDEIETNEYLFNVFLENPEVRKNLMFGEEIDAILRIILFFPQILLLENLIYQNNGAFTLSLQYLKRDIYIDVASEELDLPVSLFDLVFRALKTLEIE